MGSSPTGKTGKLEYDGGVPLLHTFNLLTGVTTASQVSTEFIAPFAFYLKAALFNISDGLASTAAILSLKRNGTAIATKSLNGLATGLVDIKSGSTTTFAGTNYLINRGDRLKMSIPNLASLGGQGSIVGNPLG